jgi:hypothetical protein
MRDSGLNDGADLNDSAGLLAAAVANNAAWCDAVCRSHGYPGTFGARVWTSPLHRLRLYPNAITVRPEATEAEAMAPVPPSVPFAVKDSFARLGLTPSGFRLLSEASWVACAPGPDGPPLDDGLSWAAVTSQGELSAWAKAWAGDEPGDVPVFRPELLADPRCTVLAGRRERMVVAGCVVYAADGVAGISNLFNTGPLSTGSLSTGSLSTGFPLAQVWSGARSAVAGMHPHLPLVGWEVGASLAAARLAGFRVLGPLRLWVRPSAAP